MTSQTETPGTICPVARSLDIVGDRWTMLVIRELFMGSSRFKDIQIQTQAAPQMLAARLKSLETNGMVERHPYSEKPLRHEYRLTEKGRAFYPVIYALRGWGETWSKDIGEEIAVRFVHRECGHDVGLESICPGCGVQVERKDLEASMSDQYAAERAERRVLFKSK